MRDLEDEIIARLKQLETEECERYITAKASDPRKEHYFSRADAVHQVRVVIEDIFARRKIRDMAADLHDREEH